MRESELGDLLARERRTAPRSARGCPDGETLLAAESGELRGDERERLLAHLERCPDCAAELSLVAELRGWAAEAAPQPAAAPVSARRERRFAAARRWLPLAASLALAVGGVAGWRLLDRTTEGERGAITPTWEVTPADGARLAAPPAELAWSAVEGARGYRVELFDRELGVVARSETSPAPRFPLPADLRLRPGETYFWRVIVRRRLDDQRSPLFSFRVAP